MAGAQFVLSTVMLRNCRSFEVTTGETILQAATKQQIAIEHSCGTGRCGVCIAGVLTGETAILQFEEALSAEDAAAGRILTCCRAPVTDVALNIESLDQLAGIRRSVVPCRISSLVRHGDSLLVVTLRLPPNARFRYLPGQHVNIIRGEISRSYSLAAAPTEGNVIELHIRRYQGGAMSAYWFDEATENDLLRMEGPLGTFFLRDQDTHSVVLLCTGTGIAPAKAILEDLARRPLAARTKVYLFWGNRHEEDFFWHPGSLELALEYVPVISRPRASWQGAVGHVQDHLLAHVPIVAEADVYACGSTAMIKDVETLLASAGHAPHRYYYDAFVSSI